MNHFLSFLLVLIMFLAGTANNAKAQQLSSFMNDSILWIETWDDVLTPWTDGVYGHFMVDDTIIGSQTYKKLYRLEFFHFPPNPNNIYPQPYQVTSQTLVAFLREDASRVYGIVLPSAESAALDCDTTGGEELLYDFSRNLNEVMDGTCLTGGRFDSITSIQPLYLFNTAFHFTFSGFAYHRYVGSERGVIEQNLGCVSGFCTSLIDYFREDIDLRVVFTGINDLPHSDHLYFYPNPAQQTFTINYSGSAGINFMEVSDISGRVLWKQNSETLPFLNKEINCDFLQQGIYFIRLFNENGKSSICKKLVIAR